MSKTTPSTAQTPALSESGSDRIAALQEQVNAAETRLAASAVEQAELNQALTSARLTAHARDTRILETQVEIRILEGARDAANGQLDTARAEVLTLTRLLAQSEPRAGSDLGADTFARTLDRQAQQLEAQTREMAELTRLLATSEEQTRALQKARSRMVSWLPELIGALLASPEAEGTDPEAPEARASGLSDAEYAKCARRLTASGAFDPAHYLNTNPDVAANGTDPALHFVKYGLTEGRAPRDVTQPRHIPATAPSEDTPAQQDTSPEAEAPDLASEVTAEQSVPAPNADILDSAPPSNGSPEAEIPTAAAIAEDSADSAGLEDTPDPAAHEPPVDPAPVAADDDPEAALTPPSTPPTTLTATPDQIGAPADPDPDPPAEIPRETQPETAPVAEGPGEDGAQDSENDEDTADGLRTRAGVRPNVGTGTGPQTPDGSHEPS